VRANIHAITLLLVTNIFHLRRFLHEFYVFNYTNLYYWTNSNKANKKKNCKAEQDCSGDPGTCPDFSLNWRFHVINFLNKLEIVGNKKSKIKKNKNKTAMAKGPIRDSQAHFWLGPMYRLNPPLIGPEFKYSGENLHLN
jgi:hypothetical protein